MRCKTVCDTMVLLMKDFNNWHSSQERTPKHTFKPKWTPDIIEWIIGQLNEMTDFVDIQYRLVKNHNISLASAGLWIEMARRVSTDMRNGLNFEDALERDRQRRNLLRKKRK